MEESGRVGRSRGPSEKRTPRGKQINHRCLLAKPTVYVGSIHYNSIYASHTEIYANHNI